MCPRSDRNWLLFTENMPERDLWAAIHVNDVGHDVRTYQQDEYQDFSDDWYAAYGKMIFAAGALENSAAELAWRLLGTPDLLTAELVLPDGLAQLIVVLRDLIVLRVPQSVRPALLDWTKKAKELAETRNRLAHANWVSDGTVAPTVEYAYSRRRPRGLRYQEDAGQWPASKLAGLAEQISNHEALLSALIEPLDLPFMDGGLYFDDRWRQIDPRTGLAVPYTEE
jgi:hypothetical protein